MLQECKVPAIFSNKNWTRRIDSLTTMLRARKYLGISGVLCRMDKYRYPYLISMKRTEEGHQGAFSTQAVFCFFVPENVVNYKSGLKKPDIENFFVNFEEDRRVLKKTFQDTSFYFETSSHEMVLESRNGQEEESFFFDPNKYHIIIVTDKMSFQGLELLENSRHHCEVLTYRDISIPLLQHHLVPRYEVVSQEDVLKLEKHYGNLRFKFPKMVAKVGPVAKYLNLQQGQVVRIFEGTSLSYRFVVDLEEEI